MQCAARCDNRIMQPVDDDDPYRLLGVHPHASANEIRLAYRQRAMMWHPDRNDRDDAADTFRRIRFAYDVLRDARRRAEYDRSVARRGGRAERRADDPAATAPREPRMPSAPDVRRRVRITLDEQLRGCRIDLRVARTEYCAVCEGAGATGAPARCATCTGSGRVRPSFGFFAFLLAEPRTCAACGGTGTLRSVCGPCAGSGVIATRRGRLHFDIPAGIPSGGTLRIRGHGRRGRNGKVSGDLVVQVEIEAHPLFEPAFPNLRCEMPISVFRALAGGNIEVPTLRQPILVPLPNDVADGTELRVTGHGMLDGTLGKRGDLLVKLRVVRPRSLSAQQRDLLVKLDRLCAGDAALAVWSRRWRDAESTKQGREKNAA